VAALLAGAWRRCPPAERLSPADLEAIAPLLAASGAGALAWHRLQQPLLRTLRAGRELRQHYRLQTLQAIECESATGTLVRRLRATGVEPLLIKGWSSALLYPEPGLRPFGDVDLCVRADQIETAAAALCAGPLPCPVDLHAEVPDLPDRAWSEVIERSRTVTVGDVAVQTLGPEDQLRLLCLHLARHGMARPLFLCDVAACLESLPAGFDWDGWRRGREHLSQWACCVVGLACRLLGACPDRVTGHLLGVPSWVEEAVLWCWGGGGGEPVLHDLGHPGEAVRRLRYRGLSKHPGVTAVRAALQLGIGPGHGLPLLLVQLAAFVRTKGPEVLRRLVARRQRVTGSLAIHRH
jgi:hypothetical protein